MTSVQVAMLDSVLPKSTHALKYSWSPATLSCQSSKLRLLALVPILGSLCAIVAQVQPLPGSYLLPLLFEHSFLSPSGFLYNIAL